MNPSRIKQTHLPQTLICMQIEGIDLHGPQLAGFKRLAQMKLGDCCVPSTHVAIPVAGMFDRNEAPNAAFDGMSRLASRALLPLVAEVSGGVEPVVRTSRSFTPAVDVFHKRTPRSSNLPASDL